MRALLRLLLAALFVLGAPTPAWATYDPPFMDELLVGSETVVYGEIVGLTETHYTLRAARWVRPGALTVKSDAAVKVRRFVDWSCRARGRPYTVGERLLVFLDRREGEFVVRGGGCEGEWWFADEAEANATVTAVASFAARYVPVGADGWVPVWHEMLRDQSPQLRRLAAAALCDTAFFNPGCGDFVLDDLLRLLADDPPRVRRRLTVDLLRLLSAEGETRALAQIDRRLRKAPAPSLAAAAVALRPYEVARHRALRRALTDPGVPLAERRHAAAGLSLADPGGDAAVAAELRAELAEWIAATEDPELRACVVDYVSDMLSGVGESAGAATDQERVLALLRKPPPDDAVRAAIERRPHSGFDELENPHGILRYLSLAGRVVAWDPRRVTLRSMSYGSQYCDTVRWMRAGLAAEKAGDVEVALEAYELALQWAEDEDFPADLGPLSPDELAERIFRLADSDGE